MAPGKKPHDCHPIKVAVSSVLLGDQAVSVQNAAAAFVTMSSIVAAAAIVAFAMLPLPNSIEAGGQFPDVYSFGDIDEDWPRG